MPHPPGDNIHLRDTVRIIREDLTTGISYGINALGLCKVLPGGGILPADVSEIYPDADLTPVVNATPCFMTRYGDCSGEKANCQTLQAVVLCAHHHEETHAGRKYPIEKGNFNCRPPSAKQG